MNYQTIEEIYAANDKIRERLNAVLEGISEETANALPEDEKWSIAKIVEHLSMVESGMMKICSKLLSAAKESGATAGGEARITGEFLQKLGGVKDVKVEAPEMVVPSGQKSIAESLAVMKENRVKLNEMRNLFDSVGCADFTFPHPAFGKLNSNEWLALIGGHEARHTAQIERLLAKIK